MRLIDADRLKTIISDDECPCTIQTAILGIIDEQPTAYDKDKVVKRLKELMQQANSEITRSANEARGTCTLYYGGEAFAYDKAIEIVKGGRADEKRD